MTGCGGSSHKAVTVTIGTPAATSFDEGDSVNLTATVENDSTNAGVTWTLSCSIASCGALSDNTSTSVTYTAPASVTTQFTITITATSVAKSTVTNSLTLTIVVPPTISTASGALAGGAVGTSYSVTLTASGGVTPYKWSVSQGALPAGLTLSSSAGTITGIPTASGSSDFTVTLTDSGSPALTFSLTFSITIAAAPAITFTTTNLTGGSVGTAYAAAVAATGGAGTLTYKVTTGSLPAGLTMSAAGAISGTPTTAGTSNFTATASDAYGDTGNASLSITIAAAPAITFTTNSLPAGVVSVVYSATVAATGGAGTLTYKVTSGSLPAGLTLSSAGAISGTPTTAGTNNFAVTASDAYGDSQNESLSIVINSTALKVSTSSLPAGVAGSAYSQTLSATGGSGTGYTWTKTAGSLPTGVTLSSTGAITGTPTTAGTFSFTVQVTDSDADTATAPLSITINAALAVSTTSLPAGTVNTSYSQSVAATGGVSPYTWSISVGSLPAGLALNASTGVISGTPTTAGTSNFTVKVTDADNNTATESLSITIYAVLSVTTTSLPGGTINVSYSQTLAAAGGESPYTWSISSGSLPAGLSLAASTGVISGTPTTAGTSSFAVKVTDANSNTATQSLSITIYAVLSVTTTTLPTGVVSTSYSQTLAAAGGVSPYTWSISSGSLPAGLSLNATSGVISGTPTTAGSAVSFTVKVTDTDSNTASENLSITINPALALTTTSLPAGTANSSYSQTLAATGGVSPYTWSISSGSLPAGLTLNASTGVISGTPTTAGTSNFTVKVTDADNNTATKSLSITVNAVLAVSTSSLPSGTVNMSYSETLAATGGVSPYTWSISVGSLPAGLTLNATTGVISGTPTAAGTSNFTVKVTDSASNTATEGLSITINAVLAVSTTSLPAGTVNTSYSQTVAATGGVSPYTWSISVGSLPAGLTLNATTGVISGTPTAPGTSNFTVKVTDSANNTATEGLSIIINAATLTVTTVALPEGTVNTPYSQSLAATGGVPPYTWSILSGSLPAGLTLTASSGLISGTPTAPASSSFEVEVADSASHTATGNVTLKILPATLAVTTLSLPNGILNEAYGSTLTATGGVLPYTWSISSGSLPAGLSLNATSGLISGTPTATGTSSFTVEATDADSDMATAMLSIKVTTPPLVVDSEGSWNGTEGVAFSQTMVASGGTPPYTWSVSSGSLPAGLTLNASTGVISGTPTTPGKSTFEVQVEDSASNTADSESLSIRIYSGLEITTKSLPSGQTSVSYSNYLTATSGTAPYTWAVVSGSLPAGLTLAGSGTFAGEITGTPTCTCTTPSTSVFQISVTDSESTPATVTATFSITINNANPPRIETTTMNSGSVGSAYSFQLQEVGGTTPLVWSVLSGTLPAGLTLASNGTIGGTPTTVGMSSFVIQLEDAASNITTRPELIQIYPSTLQIDNTTLQFANVGERYSTALDASGGSGEYLSWTITSGSLPSGLEISPSEGVISGSPAAAGSSTFTVQVEDSDSNTASATLTLTVYDNSACPSGNESELNGTYAMVVSGFSGGGLGVPVATLASFTANGAGGVTGGELDNNSGASTTGSTNVAIDAGSYYSVGASGTGCITINTVNGTNTYAFVLGGVSSGVATRGRMMEYDDDTGYGQLQTGELALQTSADFAFDKLASNFAFGISGEDSSVGRFAFGGSLTNGASGSFSDIYGDSNDNGTVNSAMSGGSGGFGTAPDANGRTTASISIGGDTYEYVAYVVNAGEVFLLSSDPITTNPVASGKMLATASSFTSSSVSGNYIFAASGADASNRGYSFTTFGILNFSAGDWSGTVYQYELDGPGTSQGAPLSLSGTYTVGATSGRIALTSAGGGTQPAVYLANSSSGTAAFVIDLDSGVGAPAYEGTVLVQPNETYSNSSVSGNFEMSVASLSSDQDDSLLGSASGSDGEAMYTIDVAGLGGAEFGGYSEQAAYTINADGTGTSGYGTKSLLLTNGTTVYLMDIGGGAAEIIEFDQQ
ncbi:MAG TPA: putative Ig domain-containing protein [Terracidiphilus sp.]|nr:putative Ig domain-containing protein [Terracidiphilus sp.]